MSEFLFDMPAEQLSPYRQWEKDHNIKAMKFDIDEWPWYAVQTTETIADYAAEYGEYRAGMGDSRDEAVAMLCKKRDIPVFGSKEKVKL